MNRSKKGKNRKLFKKKSHSNNRLGCIIAIIVLIPILFGVYLYCQQINTQNNNEPQTDISLQIPLGKDLETPIPLVPRQEQIPHLEITPDVLQFYDCFTHNMITYYFSFYCFPEGQA